ncbi:MAG: hypothetical protein Q8M65_09805 [Rhodoglobus sp.]|nr:hypothetical protein [Rhodoglobus sp.]
MNIGTQLIAIGTDPRTYYTPWFPKGADDARFTYELIHSNFGTGGTFVVTVVTKNREDAGSEGGTPVTFSQIGSTGFFEASASNLKQLVRFKMVLTPGDEPEGPGGVCYRILPPTWFAKAV